MISTVYPWRHLRNVVFAKIRHYDKIQFRKRLLGLPERSCKPQSDGMAKKELEVLLHFRKWRERSIKMIWSLRWYYLVVEEEICTFHLNNGVIEWAALWHHLHDVWWSLSMLDMAAGSKSVMLLPHICPFFPWIFPASSHVIAVFFQHDSCCLLSAGKVRPKSGIKSDELNWNLRCRYSSWDFFSFTTI